MVIGGALYFLNTEKENDQTFVVDPQWEMALDEVIRTWEQGADLNDEFLLRNCSEYRDVKVQNELIECSPKIFRCFYENRIGKIKFKNTWQEYRLKIDSLRHDREDIRVKLTINQRTLPFTLKNDCREVALPDGYYISKFYKRSANIKDKLWHTSAVRYSIDKYMVRNAEVLNWAKSKKYSQIVSTLEKENPFSVAVNLKAEEMIEFCHDHDSQVLSAKVHDALTYHHGRQSLKEIKDTPPSINTAPHPFGLRKDDGPQFKEKFSRDDCHKVYSKECLDKKVKRSFPESMGWSGVAELLGGEMEYVVNSYLPRRNLVASSYYFDFNSSWHRAGEFAYWDGQGNELRNFNFFGIIPEMDHTKKIKFNVGFRCMKKSYKGEE